MSFECQILVYEVPYTSSSSVTLKFHFDISALARALSVLCLTPKVKLSYTLTIPVLFYNFIASSPSIDDREIIAQALHARLRADAKQREPTLPRTGSMQLSKM